MLRRRMALIALVAAAPVAFASCADATQIRVRVHTDVPHSASMQVALYATPSQQPVSVTQGPWSPDGVVGSLVLVPPSGARNAKVHVRAVLSTTGDTEACERDASRCIVSERELSFAGNRTMTVPMGLYARCLGVRCASGQTCNATGACVDDALSSEACLGSEGCVLPGDPPTPPGVSVPVAEAGVPVEASTPPALLAPAVTFQDVDPRRGLVQGTLVVARDPASPGALSYQLDVVSTSGARKPLRALDAGQDRVEYTLLPGTSVEQGYEFLEVYGVASDGRRSPASRVRLDNYLRKIDIGLDIGGDLVSDPQSYFDKESARMFVFGRDVSGAVTLRRCTASMSACEALSSNGYDRLGSRGVWVGSGASRALVAVTGGPAAFFLNRCNVDGACGQTPLGIASDFTSGFAVDDSAQQVFVVTEQQGVRRLSRCGLNGAPACTTVNLDASVPRDGYWVLRDKQAPVSEGLVMIGRGTGKVFRCDAQALQCSAFAIPSSVGVGNLHQVLLYEPRHELLVLRSDGINISAVRCALDAGSCVEQVVPFLGTSDVTGDIDKDGVFYAVASSGIVERQLFRCSPEECGLLSSPFSLGSSYTGHSHLVNLNGETRWLSIFQLRNLSSEASWVVNCGLSGTDCSLSEIIAASVHGNSVARTTPTPLSLALDSAGKRVFVATMNAAVNNLPALFVCDRDGLGCRHETMQVPSSAGNGADAAWDPILSYDAVGQRLSLVVSDRQGTQRQGRASGYFCDGDGRGCVFRALMPDGAGTSNTGWQLGGIAADAGQLRVTAFGGPQVLTSRCTPSGGDCRVRLASLSTGCTGVRNAEVAGTQVWTTCSNPPKFRECNADLEACTEPLPNYTTGTVLLGRSNTGFLSAKMSVGRATIQECSGSPSSCAVLGSVQFPSTMYLLAGSMASDSVRGVHYVALNASAYGTAQGILFRCARGSLCEPLGDFFTGDFYGNSTRPSMAIDAASQRLFMAYRDGTNLGRPSLFLFDLY